MKRYSYLYFLFLLTLLGCNNEEPLEIFDENNLKIGEIACELENQYSVVSRSYYDLDNSKKSYFAKWHTGDQIAVNFDGSNDVKCFNLVKGEDTPYAIFSGPIPITSKKMVAVYPFDIYKGVSSNSVEIFMPSSVSYRADKILSGVMPMFAHGSVGSLNFYNLMAVLKVTVVGRGLLRNVTISSVDGYGMSGNGRITIDENNIPALSFEDNNTKLTVSIGSFFLSTTPVDIYLPIPARRYEKGLNLEFEFDGGIEKRELIGPLVFERSILRPVNSCFINVDFNQNNFSIKDNEIWYKSSDEQRVYNESAFGSSILSNSFLGDYDLSVVTTSSAIVKIGGELFESPESITDIKLPSSVQEIAMRSFYRTSIKRFDAPINLKTIGTDAFYQCKQLTHIVLNEGLESIGMEAFGDCPYLTSVFIPKTVKLIGAYSFKKSTRFLDHWDGECPLIDEDRHTLYSNSAYGYVSEIPENIEIVAGCNLIEYSIPNKALYTQNYSLDGLSKLKKLIVHEKFISFGLDVFSLPSLETIICYANTPPTFDANEKFESKSLKEIKVPESSLEQYKNAEGWKEFSDIIVAI